MLLPDPCALSTRGIVPLTSLSPAACSGARGSMISHLSGGAPGPGVLMGKPTLAGPTNPRQGPFPICRRTWE
jgi:hypothetical protein